MDISRLKKMFAGVSAVAVSLTLVGTAVAYSDVPAGAWYGEAVEAFTDAGYLDGSQPRFRGGDLANRAEFIKLIVELNGGILSTPPAVPSFDDVAPGAWYYGYMEEAGKEGWVKGDGNCYGSHPCRARPSQNINRAEAAALIVRAFGLESSGDAPQFVDNPSGQWFTDLIQTAADACVLQGNGGRVRPNDSMNRAEMVTMLYRVDQNLEYSKDCPSDSTSTDEPMVIDATATSASTVEVEFNMDVDSTTAGMVSRYMVTDEDGKKISVSSVSIINDSTVELTLATSMSAGADYTVSVDDMKTSGGEMFSDSASFSGFSPIVKGDGVLEVSLAANNPAGDTVPRGAVGVTLTSLDLTASCDDAVTIQEITVLHEGFGDEGDIDGVYASVDGARVTRKRTIDSQDQTSDLRFSQALTVPACGTVTVDVMADFSSTSTVSAEHNIAVELPSDVRGNAKDVTGNFPLRGGTFKIAAVTSGKVTVSYRTISPDKVEVGEKSATLGRFELSTDSVEDQTIYSMTFEQNGTVGDGDVTDIVVERSDGTALTNAAASTVGDFVTLVFDPPFTILQGDKITLSVVGDIAGGAGETVVFHFEESSDLFAVGSLYGYGVNGQLYGSQISISSSTSADSVSIDAGQFTLEIDGPVQQKYTRDDNNAVLANLLFTTGGESVDIKKLFVAIQGQTSSGGGLLNNAAGTSDDNVHESLENVQLRNKTTGQTISAVRLTGSTDFATGVASTTTYQVYRFDDFVVNGKETWEIRADFINNGSSAHPKSGDRFRAIVCGEPQSILDSSNTLIDNTTGCSFGLLGTASESYQMEIEGLSTGDAVGDVRPRGNIAGNFHRISAPELNIAVKGSVASDIAVKNSKDINLFRFEARAGEAEDVLLTKATFSALSGSLLNGQNYSLWVDTDGDSKVDTALEKGQSSQSSKITFDDLANGGFVIPAEQTVTFEVHADIAASLSGDDLKIHFSTGSTDFLEAEQVDNGSSLSGFKYNGTILNSASSADIIISTTSQQVTNFVLVNQGNLYVIKDTSPVRSRQLLAGSLSDSILQLQFRAENEDIDVTDLQITSSGSTAVSVDRLELYKVGATSPFASATTSGCGSDDALTLNVGTSNSTVTTFCANMESRQLVIPEGDRVSVLVRARLKTDTAGAARETIGLFLASTGVSNETTGSGSIRARGMQSSNNLSGNSCSAPGTMSCGSADGEVFIGVDSNAANTRIVGNANQVVFAKVASITNANPDADNTAVPTGVNPIGMFKFTAAANSNLLNGPNKWTLSGVIFTVNASNVLLGSGDQTSTATSDFRFYNVDDTSTKHTCTASNVTASGTLTVTCSGLRAGSVSTAINPAESETFALEADVVDSEIGTSGSNLQVTINNFTSIGASNFGTAANTRSSIEWLDEDTTVSVFNWIEFDNTQVKSTGYKNS